MGSTSTGSVAAGVGVLVGVGLGVVVGIAVGVLVGALVGVGSTVITGNCVG